MSKLTTASPPVELALLGFLRHGPSHGYEIYHQLSRASELRVVWRMKQSRLYALLGRLEEQGLLRATLEPQETKPPRKVFHLTAQGEAAYREWLEQPVDQPREMRLAFMLKLYFAMQEGGEPTLRLIERQRTVCAEWLEVQAGASDEPFIRAVRGYRRAHIGAIRDWLASLPAEMLEAAGSR
jgi:DNA-binding PadR family transcriptional regulator